MLKELWTWLTTYRPLNQKSPVILENEDLRWRLQDEFREISDEKAKQGIEWSPDRDWYDAVELMMAVSKRGFNWSLTHDHYNQHTAYTVRIKDHINHQCVWVCHGETLPLAISRAAAMMAENRTRNLLEAIL